MLAGLQYRLLRAMSRVPLPRLDGSVKEPEGKLRVFFGDRIYDEIRGKDVIDFGCGQGKESIDMALRGARRVIGLDIQPKLLEIARKAAVAAGVASRCEFMAATTERADIVISLDAFEHYPDPAGILETMSRLLRPDGHVEISTGYFWYHPLGGHLVSAFPWAHLVCGESALLRYRNDLRPGENLTRLADAAGGLNRMTFRRFERLVEASAFRIADMELRPIRSLAPIHCRLTREFTTSTFRCRLVLKSAPSASERRQ